MKKNSILCKLFLLPLTLLTLTACGKSGDYAFGTGNIGGNYYAYGNAIAGLMQNDEVKLNVKTTAGSAANLRLIQKGFLDMAIVQSDTLLDAYNGNGVFQDSACKGIRAVAGLYTEECQIVVNADSDIFDIQDLYGRKVSVGEKESGVMQNAEQILLVNGLNLKNISAEYLSFSDSAIALKNGEIEAFFCTAGAPTTSIQELSKEMNIRLISLDDKTCDMLTSEYPCYSKCIIPAGTYAGQEEDVTTLGVKAVLVVSDKMSEEFVHYLTDTLFIHADEMQYATSGGVLNAEFATTAIPAPFHKGASKWYEENNITVITSEEGHTFYGINASQD